MGIRPAYHGQASPVGRYAYGEGPRLPQRWPEPLRPRSGSAAIGRESVSPHRNGPDAHPKGRVAGGEGALLYKDLFVA